VLVLTNLVQQGLRILGKAVKDIGTDYTTNFQSLINDANEIRENVTKTAKDSVTTYNQIRKTNIAKTISDWFFERESEMDQDSGDGEFDAGFKLDSADDEKRDGDSKPSELNSDTMQDISNKQTSAMYKIAHKQTEQSMVNAAEIISAVNTNHTQTLAAIDNLNKSVISISEKLDKLIELQGVTLGLKNENKERQKENKPELFDSNGHFRLAGAYNVAKEGFETGDIANMIGLASQFFENGKFKLSPDALVKMGLEKLTNREFDFLGGKSIDDLGNKFNESIATAADTVIGKILSNDMFKMIFGDATELRNADTNYASKVKNHYNTEKATFDGMTRHSIIRVIPEYLKKIAESVSGKTWNVTEKGELTTATPTNQFDKVTRRAYQYGGVSGESINKITDNLKQIDSSIKSEDVQKASRALMGVITMTYHNNRRRMITIDQITGDQSMMTQFASQAADMMINAGYKGSKAYWSNICMTIMYRMANNRDEASTFMRTINQNVEGMMREASEFAKSGSIFSGQARNLTFDMMKQQFAAEMNPKRNDPNYHDNDETGFRILQNLNGNNKSNEDQKPDIGSIDKNNNIIGSSKDDDLTTKDYARGIFTLLNRGINVKVTNFKRPKDYYKPLNIRQKQEQTGENRSEVIDGLVNAITGGLNETLNGDALLRAAGGKPASAMSEVATGLANGGIIGGLGAAGNLASAGLMGIMMGAGKGIGATGISQIIKNIQQNGGIKSIKDLNFGTILSGVKGVDEEKLNSSELKDKTVGEYVDERKEKAKETFDNAKEKAKEKLNEAKENVDKAIKSRQWENNKNERWGVEEVEASTEPVFDVEDPDSLKGRAQTFANENINKARETVANIKNSTAKSRHRISMALFGDGTSKHKSMGEGIKNKATQIRDDATEWVADKADKGLTFLEDATAEKLDENTKGGKFTATIQKGKSAIGNAADTSKKILSTITSGFSFVGKILGSIAKALTKLAVKGVLDVKHGIKNLNRGLFGDKKSKTPGLLTPVVNAVKGIGDFAKKTYKGIKDLKNSAKNVLKEWASSGINFVKQSFKDLSNDILKPFSDKLKQDTDKATAPLRERIANKINPIKDKFTNSEFGKNFLKGFQDAKKEYNNLENKVQTVADRASLDMKKMFTGENSEWKQNGPLGIIAATLERINGKLNDVTDNQEKELKNDSTKSDSSTSDVIDDTVDAVTGEAVKAASSGAEGGVIDAVTGAASSALSGTVAEGAAGAAGAEVLGAAGAGAAGAAGAAGLGALAGPMGAVLGGLLQIGSGILKLLVSAIGSLSGVTTLKELVSSIITDGIKPLNQIFKRLTKILRPLAYTLKNTLNVLATAVSDIVGSLLNGIQPLIESIEPLIRKIFNLVLQPLLDGFTALVDVIMVPILGVVKYVVEPKLILIGNILNGIQGLIQVGTGLLLSGIGGAVSAIGGMLKVFGVGDAIAERGQELTEKGQSYMESGKNSISNAVTSQIQYTKSLWKDLTSGNPIGDMLTEDIPTVSGQYNPTTGGSIQDGLAGNGDSIYNYYYGSGNSYVTNQHHYGNTLNMSDRGCGPVALADAYNRRTGANISPLDMAMMMSTMGSGNAYDTNRGTSVGGFIKASNALGMNAIVGGVTAKSLKRATPNNPITLLGSGTDFGTKNGNNHYVNVIGADKNGYAYVSNPMSGRIERRSATGLAMNSTLGIYGSGDTDYSYATKIAMNDETRAALDTLKDYQSQVFKYFSGETESDRTKRKLQEQENQLKSESLKYQFSDEEYQNYYDTAYALFQAENPKYDGESDTTYQERFEKNLYKYLQKAGATDDLISSIKNEYTTMKEKTDELDEAQARFVTGMQSALDSLEEGSMWTAMNGGKKYGRFVGGNKSVLATNYEGENGGDSYRYEPTVLSTSIGENDTDEFLGSNIHEFFYQTTKNQDVTAVTTKDGGWFKNRQNPSSKGRGSSGSSNYGIDIEFEGNASPTIAATTDGVVLNVGKNGSTSPFSNGGDGNYVQIVDADGNVHTYAYLKDTPLVERDQKVEGGQPIGVVGNTGLGSAHTGMKAVLQYRIAKPTNKIGKDFTPSFEEADQINPLEYFGLKTFMIPNQNGSSSANGSTVSSVNGTLGQISINEYLQSGANTFDKSYANKNYDEFFSASNANGIVPEAQAQIIGMQLWEDNVRKITGEKSLTKVVSDSRGQLAYGLMNWIPTDGTGVGGNCTEKGTTLKEQLAYMKKAYYAGDQSTSKWAKIISENYNGSKEAGEKVLGHPYQMQPGQYWGSLVNQDLVESTIHYITHALQPGGHDCWTSPTVLGKYAGSAAAAWNWMLANGKANASGSTSSISESATTQANTAMTGIALSSPSTNETSANTDEMQKIYDEGNKKIQTYVGDTDKKLSDEELRVLLGADYSSYIEAKNAIESIDEEETSSEVENVGIDSKGVFFLKELPGSAIVSLLSSLQSSSASTSSGSYDSSSTIDDSSTEENGSTSGDDSGFVGPVYPGTESVQDYNMRKAFRYIVTHGSDSALTTKAAYRTRLRENNNYSTDVIESGNVTKNFDSLWNTLKSTGSLQGIGVEASNWTTLRQNIKKYPDSYMDSSLKTKVLGESVNNGNIWTSAGNNSYQDSQKTDFTQSQLLAYAKQYYQANKKQTSDWDDGDWATFNKYFTKNSNGVYHSNNQTLDNAATLFYRVANYIKTNSGSTSAADSKAFQSTFGNAGYTAIRGLGDISSEILGSLDYDPTAEIPKIDESLSNINSYMKQNTNFDTDYAATDDGYAYVNNNTYVIKKDNTKEDQILEALGSYTFEVRARKVESLLETIIEKMDNLKPDNPTPISGGNSNPDLFSDDSIPDQVTRLARG
jgi:murein DD-endopeptidase MepM/ murein hydrolase activator NlpD